MEDELGKRKSESTSKFRYYCSTTGTNLSCNDSITKRSCAFAWRFRFQRQVSFRFMVVPPHIPQRQQWHFQLDTTENSNTQSLYFCNGNSPGNSSQQSASLPVRWISRIPNPQRIKTYSRERHVDTSRWLPCWICRQRMHAVWQRVLQKHH